MSRYDRWTESILGSDLEVKSFLPSSGNGLRIPELRFDQEKQKIKS